MFVDALKLRNRYGLLSEDVHPHDRETVGQFSADLFDVGIDLDRDQAVAELGRPLLARLFVVSNRVGVPDRNARAGGLEVAIRPTLRQARRPVVRLERPRRPTTIRARPGSSSTTTSPTSPPICARTTSRNTTTASPTACCGRSCITGSTWPNSRAAISAAISASTSFSPGACEKLLKPDDIVWVHDYHLIPLAKALRERGHANKIGFFIHIPFPPPEIITAMPNHDQLIPALCHYDLVGFQTEVDAANFSRYIANECGLPWAGGNSFHSAIASCASARSRSASRPKPSRGWRGAPSRAEFVREVLDSLSGPRHDHRRRPARLFQGHRPSG